MKMLFICGVTPTKNGLVCASWINGIISRLGSDFELAVLPERGQTIDEQSVEALGKSILILSSQLWDSAESFAKTLERENIGAVVIFGTESPYTLPAVELCKKAGVLHKTALFAQGIACACAKHYAEGLPHRVVTRRTFRDFLRRSNIKAEQNRMESRAENERKAIEQIRHFIGRTTLDLAVLRMYNSKGAYYKCNDILRSCFYSGKWSLESCEKHRIFISQYYYPLKGFHYLLEAAAMLKEKYPDLIIAAAGYNPIEKSLAKRELKDSSYIRYIKSLITKYNLQNSVELLGELDAEQMKHEYLRANVFVMPSTIENSPNSLAEAMMLGTPCVVSDVGGISDLAEHRTEAFIYPSSASYLLTHYLDRLFSDEKTALRLSENGRLRALREYDSEENIKQLEKAFTDISETKKEGNA